LGGHAHRARRLRDPVHLRLLAGLDVAGRRPDGGGTRFLRRGGLCDLQGADRDRAVRHGGDRISVHADDAAGTDRRLPGRALPARRIQLQRSRRPGAGRRLCALAAAPARTRRDGGGRLSLCLVSAGVTKTLAVAAFTLAWTHSIEKIEWQEDWRVTPAGLE